MDASLTSKNLFNNTIDEISSNDIFTSSKIKSSCHGKTTGTPFHSPINLSPSKVQ